MAPLRTESMAIMKQRVVNFADVATMVAHRLWEGGLLGVLLWQAHLIPLLP